MSALIPMTKLPDNCAIGGRDGLGCPCFCHYNEECQLLGEIIHTAYFSEEKRPERCPLQFVPPHGRLGDLDELKERATKRLYASNHGSMAEAYYASIIDLIDRAPTVIEAEEGEA